MDKIPEKLAIARVIVQTKFPYFAVPLWSLFPVAAPDMPMPTMGVDEHWRLYYHPDFVEATPGEELAGVLVHEISHLIRDHAGRGKTFDQDGLVGTDATGKPVVSGWNIAGDLEINDKLKDQVKLPNCKDEHGKDMGMPLCPELYKFPRGLLAEEYYDLLRKQAEKNKPIRGQCCGSGADGHAQGHEKGQGDKDGQGQEKHPSIGKEEADWIRRQTAEAVKQAGNVPDDLKRWAEAVLNKRVPWQKILAGKIRQSMGQVAGMIDYTYKRPSRRQPGEVIMPSLRAPKPEIAIVVDTSGSVGQEDIASALGQVQAIIKSLGGAPVNVLSVDAAVHGRKRVAKASKADIRGGGGTDMGVGLAAALETKPRPHFVVILTDGYTPWPKATPPVPVVVGLIGQTVDDKCPAWAKVVRIE